LKKTSSISLRIEVVFNIPIVKPLMQAAPIDGAQPSRPGYATFCGSQKPELVIKAERSENQYRVTCCVP
jgi:hypothetical protein